MCKSLFSAFSDVVILIKENLYTAQFEEKEVFSPPTMSEKKRFQDNNRIIITNLKSLFIASMFNINTWDDVTKPNCQHCYESEVEGVEEGEIFLKDTEIFISVISKN